jgi:hypothetical protein
MSMTLSEKDIDDLLFNGNLTIDKNIRWKLKSGQRYYEFRVPVLNTYQGNIQNLELIGTKNAQLNKYSFALMLDDRRIRGVCPYVSHINRHPKREIVKAPHKHKWDDHCQDSYAYIPPDITNVKDIHQTFNEFLKECFIIHKGTFNPPPPTQPELSL